MSHINRYTKFIAEQARRSNGFVTENQADKDPHADMEE